MAKQVTFYHLQGKIASPVSSWNHVNISITALPLTHITTPYLFTNFLFDGELLEEGMLHDLVSLVPSRNNGTSSMMVE